MGKKRGVRAEEGKYKALPEDLQSALPKPALAIHGQHGAFNMRTLYFLQLVEWNANRQPNNGSVEGLVLQEGEVPEGGKKGRRAIGQWLRSSKKKKVEWGRDSHCARNRIRTYA